MKNHASLSNCDMRASIYKNVKFTDANLENVDFRHSSFETVILQVHL